MTSAKGFYQIGSLVPGSKCWFTPHPLHQSDTTCQNFRITMDIDFPYDADFEKEIELLETQAQRLRKEHQESISVFDETFDKMR